MPRTAVSGRRLTSRSPAFASMTELLERVVVERGATAEVELVAAGIPGRRDAVADSDLAHEPAVRSAQERALVAICGSPRLDGARDAPVGRPGDRVHMQHARRAKGSGG